jgi:hypothetical protein
LVLLSQDEARLPMVLTLGAILGVRVLRRRATHNRLFDRLTDLKRLVRNNLGYFRTTTAPKLAS